METEITIIYMLCDELTKTMDIKEDIQIRMSNAEVMTVVLTSARFFGGNIHNAPIFLKEHGYIPNMPSESRLNRRIHAIDGYIMTTIMKICFLMPSESFSDLSAKKILSAQPILILSGLPPGTRGSGSKPFSVRLQIFFRKKYMR